MRAIFFEWAISLYCDNNAPTRPNKENPLLITRLRSNATVVVIFGPSPLTCILTSSPHMLTYFSRDCHILSK